MSSISYTAPTLVCKLRLPLRFIHFGEASGWRDENKQCIETYEIEFPETYGVTNMKGPSLLAASPDAFKDYKTQLIWDNEVVQHNDISKLQRCILMTVCILLPQRSNSSTVA